MSLIEKAARRLEQLKNAGVDISGTTALEQAAPAAAPDPTPATPLAAAEPAALRATAPRAPATPVAAAPTAAPVAPAATVAPAALVSTTPESPRATPSPAKFVGTSASQKIDIDLIAMRAAGFLSTEAANTQLAHELRIVKRPLLRNAQGKGGTRVQDGNLIMVTSALPGEGKSFVSLNLALSIAMELDSTVLYIDADVIKPSLPRMLDLPRRRGLMDLLTNRSVQVQDVLLKTNIDRFTIMQAGTPHERAAELLASDTMVELVQEIGRRYPDRIVLFDSPPLLATTESRVLASHMGQIVLVVEEGRTRIGTVKEALATIESCPVVMTLLNKTSGAMGTGYYGYYGSYGASAREANA